MIDPTLAAIGELYASQARRRLNDDWENNPGALVPLRPGSRTWLATAMGWLARQVASIRIVGAHMMQ